MKHKGLIKGIVVNEKFLQGSELELKSQKTARQERDKLISELRKQLKEIGVSKKDSQNQKKKLKKGSKVEGEGENKLVDDEDEILDQIQGLEAMNKMEYRPLIYDFIVIDTPGFNDDSTMNKETTQSRAIMMDFIYQQSSKMLFLVAPDTMFVFFFCLIFQKFLIFFHNSKE